MARTKSPTIVEGTHCPECAAKGKKVKRITLESLLAPDAAPRIGDAQYRFCDSIDCKTVYFGDDGTTFSKSDLTVRVGVKEHTSPRHVCYCFDHTIEEIDAEVRDTGQSSVLDDIKTRMKDACWCETKSPQGSCCLGTVGKYVKQALAEQGATQDVSAIDEESADCCAAGAHCNSAPDSKGTAVHDCCSNTDTTLDVKDKGQRTGMLAVGGSVLSALAASACCWIPLLLIAFGVSAGGVSAWFEQYRWLFLGITAVLLGTGFYFVYFRKPHCAPGSACATPNIKLQRFSRVMLWVATVVVIATAAFPKYVGYLIPEDEPAQITIPANHVATASVGIEGMTCEACAIHVKDALMKVPGVLDVVVSYPDSAATVRFDDTSPPAVDALASAVEGAGYKADTGTFTNRTPWSDRLRVGSPARNMMMIRGSQLSLLIALLGSAAFVVSCSTPSRATSSANHDVTSATPHLVTVLQAEGWGNTESAVALVESYAAELSLNIQIERIVVRTDADVEKHKFLGSPTVRINGLDVEPSARSNTQYGFTWRLMDWTQGASETKEMLHDAFREAGWAS